MVAPHRPSALALALIFFFPAVFAGVTNLTIDDTNSTFFDFVDNTNANPPSWAEIVPGDPCLYCSAQPQTTQIYNQTWHDGSVGSEGSAVYIYGIDLADPGNISFTMGDDTTFHYYTGAEQFVFRALFFEAENLGESVSHTVSWVINKSAFNGTTGLFDYAVITVQESTTSTATTSSRVVPTRSSASSTSKKSKTGAIVGALVGVIGGLTVLAAIILLVRRKRPTSAISEDSGPRVRRVRGNYVVQSFAESAPPPSQAPPASLDTIDAMTLATTAPVSRKTLDVGWTEPDRSMVSMGSNTSPVVTLPRDLDISALAPTVSTMTASAREQFLEDRIAIMEAHVSQHLPPPYVRTSRGICLRRLAPSMYN
ncbi:hypothetical protein B0H14DRAFT_3040503 [Mycena olivaceomarginata]|nr:hypothetical protein B0H14DRAFT_3040503 [Mycena olivaceomarginata]